jgi:hypothetical protein
MRRQPSASLCPELDAILQAELRAGNQLGEGPLRTDWPQPGSIYAALRDSLKTRKPGTSGPVRHSICNDPHYGWNDECYCELHRDLLVAGSTQPPRNA